MTNEITKEVLACENCGRNYRIVDQELKFYREHHLSIPRLCFKCRHQRRVSLRGPKKLWNGDVRVKFRVNLWHEGKRCPHQFQTTYSPERPEKVFCEQCYLKEVY